MQCPTATHVWLRYSDHVSLMQSARAWQAVITRWTVDAQNYLLIYCVSELYDRRSLRLYEADDVEDLAQMTLNGARRQLIVGARYVLLIYLLTYLS